MSTDDQRVRVWHEDAQPCLVFTIREVLRRESLYIELFIASYYMVMEDKSQDYYQGLVGYMLPLSLWRPAPSLAGHPIA